MLAAVVDMQFKGYRRLANGTGECQRILNVHNTVVSAGNDEAKENSPTGMAGLKLTLLILRGMHRASIQLFRL